LLRVRVSPRRFPPRWSVEELDACYVVRDHDGQQLAYVYFEDEPGRRSAAKLLTKDEARRIAVNIAKLPDWCENKSSAGAWTVGRMRHGASSPSRISDELLYQKLRY